MQEEGVEVPTAKPEELLPPSLPVPSDQQDEDKASTIATPTLNMQSLLHNQEALFAMPQLQVCDILTTDIVGIEVTIIIAITITIRPVLLLYWHFCALLTHC